MCDALGHLLGDSDRVRVAVAVAVFLGSGDSNSLDINSLLLPLEASPHHLIYFEGFLIPGAFSWV